MGVNSVFDYLTVISQKAIGCILFSFEYRSVVWVENGYIIFVKSAKQSESYSCPIGMRLAILRFGYVRACVVSGGNID